MRIKTIICTAAASLAVAATPAAAMLPGSALRTERPVTETAYTHDAVQPRDYQNVTPPRTIHDAVEAREYQSTSTPAIHDATLARDYTPPAVSHDAQMLRPVVDVPAPTVAPADDTDIARFIIGGLFVLLAVPAAVVGVRRIRPKASRV